MVVCPGTAHRATGRVPDGPAVLRSCASCGALLVVPSRPALDGQVHPVLRQVPAEITRPLLTCNEIITRFSSIAACKLSRAVTFNHWTDGAGIRVLAHLPARPDPERPATQFHADDESPAPRGPARVHSLTHAANCVCFLENWVITG